MRYDQKTVEHMMRLQGWRELRWILEESHDTGKPVGELIEKRLHFLDNHDLSNLIPDIDFRKEFTVQIRRSR